MASVVEEEKMREILDRLEKRETKLAVVGLGYVGLPLALAFSEKFAVVGFDIDSEKIELLNKGIDPTGEIADFAPQGASIEFTTDPAKLRECHFIVVSVPTPVDRNNQPDLTHLKTSSATVGSNMPARTVVVYESTVYPGVTEDECVPLLEKHSGMQYRRDFCVGYSPERINPGDSEHRLQKVTKIVSGCNDETLDLVAGVYGRIVEAGVYRAPSIKVAEAAKVIENTQRDVNIALMNELAIIFHRLGIDTQAVLRAAGTKWNFLKFFPGLVGGHCIGVDPFYLTYKAEEVGYRPEVILSGRRINDSMGKFVAENTVKKLIRAGKAVKGAKMLILGLTFKENVADIRRSKVFDIIRELDEYMVETLVHDPLANAEAVRREYGREVLTSITSLPPVDAVILAVPHQCFGELSLEKLAGFCRKEAAPVVIDVRGVFDQDKAAELGIRYWRL